MGTWALYPLRQHQQGKQLNIERFNTSPGLRGKTTDFSVTLRFLNAGLCFSAHQRGLLYQGVHGGSSMVAMGKAGFLSHSLGGYGLPSSGTSDYSQSGFYHSVSLQRGMVNPWQPTQASHESHGPHISSGMSSGGCSFPSQPCSSNSSHLPSFNLSIKSERSSPDHMSSPPSPSLHHLRQRSPDVARRSPPESHPANRTKEFPKASYLQGQEEKGQPLRQLELSNSWQR
ncbi:myocyte-specific enhancer factor 2B [Austrofundulus limnaeus]|uniref:Myocyte-specific enhancer factor 2B n=1 Tax=Austrofundulus limnaeus TaxID=52670 RepID=A0A2I4BWV3_AUSLI|nr:PREDICTED: uncharacterized protein LOC106523343 [Austrofundulus limnaeus]